MIRKSLIIVAAIAAMNASAGSGLLVRGGLNVANATLHPEGGRSSSPRGGLEAGILFDIPVASRGYIMLGGLFDQKGYVMSGGLSGETKVRVNYFTIPVMVSTRGPLANASGVPVPAFFLNLGVELSPLWGAQIDFGGGSEDYTDATGFDFGLRAETGFEIPLETPGRTFTLGVGYSYGLINSNDMDDNLNPPEQHNYVIKVFAAYKFGFAPRAAAPAR